ncbi:alpha/beta hydrolase [Aliifodinibius salipaludis]|uniref:Alpha/beta hydrolase n=1 Tax=Fodinibius salipaludis TaxID=2032627 RepID=A0A2A2GBB2_9BACT|nr:alpha/beta fold hydrolase [Aliifodinibius salipaludis]PAU94153.1 alpha/beta hydrolase [Aliifodinibius salipaludis]
MDERKRISVFLVGFILLLVFSTGSIQAQINQFSDLDYPYSVEYQQLEDGQKVAYMDKGKGEPIILIHGLGSYIPAWKQTIPALSEKYRVIALDLPGYGKSSKDVDSYSIPSFAKTVADLQDSLEIEKATWAGHSMGSQIALWAAIDYPDKISRLVLLAPAGFETFTEQEGAMMSNFVTPQSIKATPDSLIRQTFKATFYDFPKEAQFMIEDRVAIRSAENFDGYARAYAGSVQAMLDGPVFEELSRINHPSLIIFGKQDMLIPNRQLHSNLTTKKVAESGHEQLPNSKLKIIDQAGHFVHFEQPEMVNKEILNFLNSK